MLNFDIQQFCRDTWQQRPLILRNAIKGFTDILDEHELAGLAMEPEIDSRIVAQTPKGWQFESGPFSEFEPFCQGQWTLLVQGVEAYVPEAQALLDEFLFLPNWRIDDLMVSYSVAGAGVGPHLDNYDVFIIQGKGSRRWQVGEKGQHATICPHPKLRQIEPFTPIIDEVLTPGDIIYIPPGFPHNGVALEPCLNYSVGFRSPTQADLLASFADYLLANGLGKQHYADPAITLRHSTSILKQHEIAGFRTLMQQSLSSPQFDRWLMNHCSQSKLDESEYGMQDIECDTLLAYLNSGNGLTKACGVKTCLLQPPENATSFVFSVNGQDFHVEIEHLESVINFLDQPVWHINPKDSFKKSSLFIQNMTTLVKEGLWFMQ